MAELFRTQVMEIEALRSFIRVHKPIVTDHAIREMDNDEVTLDDVLNAIYMGEIIEDYPKAFPLPACLINGQTLDGRPVHVCLSLPPLVKIITVYVPSSDKWQDNFRRRKKR